MAIGTVLGFSGSPGSSQTTTPAATLPTIATDGYAVAFIGTNLGSTTTVTTAPSGWTLLDGPYDNASNNMRVWLYGKAVTSADSGGSFSATLSGASRWAVGGAYLPGASGVDGTVSRGQWIDNTDDLAIDVPAITPGVADTYRLVLVYDRSVSGALTVTPPAGWTELADACSTNASGARFGAWVGGVQLTGQSGVAQATAQATYSTSARNNGWQLTIAPASASTSASLTGVAAAAAAAAVAGVVTAVQLAGLTGTPTASASSAPSGTVTAQQQAAAAGVAATSTSTATPGTVTTSAGGTSLSLAGVSPASVSTALPGAVVAVRLASPTGAAAGSSSAAVTGAIVPVQVATADGVPGSALGDALPGDITPVQVVDLAGDAALSTADAIAGTVRAHGGADGRPVATLGLQLDAAALPLTLDNGPLSLTLDQPSLTLEIA